MQIMTTRFGEVQVSEESVLHMPEGMLGFPSCHRFVLLQDNGDTPYKWMQAVDDPALAFVVVNPLDFFEDYNIELADEDAQFLGLDDPSDAALMTTVTVDKEQGRITTNLLGPVVINSSSLHAKQVVLQDERYGTKHTIIEDAGTIACQGADRRAA